MDETTLKELKQRLTDSAVETLRLALTVAHAHSIGTELADAVEHLTECRLVVTADRGTSPRAQVLVELYAPARIGGEMCFFAIPAAEVVLQ